MQRKTQDKQERESMTDQTRWGIDQVQTKNKAIRRQKDIINRAISEIDKLEEEWFLELMLQLEGIYETKYGQKKAHKDNKLVL